MNQTPENWENQIPAWSLSPPSSLAAQQFHLWRSPLLASAGEIEAFATLLSTDEQVRADRFRFPIHRQRFIVGRGKLRSILGHYLGIDPAAVPFTYQDRGKPAVVMPSTGPALEFNLSHSEDWLLCGVAWGDRVGVDLEALRSVSDLDTLTRRFFSPQEHTAIQALPDSQRHRAFFQYWTVKEAVLKASGQGLGALESVEMIWDGPNVRLIGPIAPWRVRSLWPIEGFVGAIAQEPPADPNGRNHTDTIQYFQW